MPATAPAVEGRVVLADVDWQTYARLRDVPGNRNLRMTYDRGVLEIVSPSKLHERITELLGRLILAWTEVHDIPVQSCGSMTCRGEWHRRGLEPDKCYYVQHESAVREREEIDLAIDPPPDLAVEVDVSHLSTDRLPIYAALRVAEVWRWAAGALELLVLDESGRYVSARESQALPGFPIDEAARVLERRHAADETSLARAFRRRIQRGRES